MRPAAYIVRLYVIPALAIVITAAVAFLIGSGTGTYQPRFFFTFPVLLCAWFSGVRAGIVATVLSAVTIEYFFEPPFFAFDWGLLQTVLFIVDGIIISLFAAAKGTTEERLQNFNKELESRIAERSEELERINRALREREVLAALGTAVAKIGHEIANPVNSISIAVEGLEHQLEGSSGAIKYAPLVHSIAEDTERLKQFIGELKQISRPLTPKLSAVKLSDVTAEAVATVHAMKGGPTIGIEQHFPDELPAALADREKMRAVIMNLLTNAFDAMPRGGSLLIRAYAANDRVHLEIRDTGVGIPKHMNPFDLFVTSKQNGWGLGLAIVRQFILAQDGTINYISEEGRGTTFRISLPIYEQKI